MTSLKDFFKTQPLHTISIGQILDYIAWRRGMNVKEVTLRHDLHALSPLYQYGIAHNWCRHNLVTSQNLKAHGSKIPSDADAIRMHVLTPAEERKYFDACLRSPHRITVKSKPHVQTRKGKRVAISGCEYSKVATHDYRDLHDIGRLMLLTGARPGEVMQARVEHVNVEQGTWFIPRSKSASGKRVLRLSSEAQSIMAGRIAQFAKSGLDLSGEEGRRTST
jgi:integrase